jgi:hypothetical protein
MEKIPVRLTNEMLVRDLIGYPSHGMLGQAFIVEAIRHYADTIAANPAPLEDGNGVVSAKVWHAIATDVSTRIKENNAL